MRAHLYASRFVRALGAASLAGLSLLLGCGSTVDTLGIGGGGGSGNATSAMNGSTAANANGTPSATASGTDATSASGLDVSSSSGGATCAGFGDACTACESTSCAVVWCGCKNEPECPAILQCSKTCSQGDQACNQACILAHQAGVSAALLVSDCAATTCNASCNFGTAQPPCTLCLLDKCSAAMNACFADTECLPLYQCLAACPPASLTCQQGCYNTHGAGVPTLQAVSDCRSAQCPQACAN